MLCCRGPCRAGAGGRDAGFAGAGSAELAPGEAFLLGGGERLAAPRVPDGPSYAYRWVPRQRWQPAIAPDESRMFVV